MLQKQRYTDCYHVYSNITWTFLLKISVIYYTLDNILNSYDLKKRYYTFGKLEFLVQNVIEMDI